MILPRPRAGLPIVLLSGTPSQRGLQHGDTFADRIALALMKMRESHTIAALARAREIARHSWSQLSDEAPAIAAEIRGMAEGAGADHIDLYCHIGFEFFDAPAAIGCSGIAVASPDGALLGQNWDAPPEAHADLALFLHVGGDGLELAMVGSIGTLGWVGQNRFGLALLTNDLMLDRAISGLPSQVMRRLALAQKNVPAALAWLERQSFMGGRCYLLGDRAGNIAAVELSPAARLRVMPNAARIMHTNHALMAPTIAIEDEAWLQAIYPSSRSRLQCLEHAGQDAKSANDIMTALRDRRGAPNAVSKTPSPDEPTETAFSIIFDCGAHAFHLCAGPPSSGQYQYFEWSTLSAGTPVTGAMEATGEASSSPPTP